MNDLIEGILEFSKLGNQKSIETFELGEIIKEIEEDLNYLIAKTKAKINFENLPKINTNRLDIRLLFQNLISNSLKFKKDSENPIVDIKSSENSDFWQFTVSDNGIGIQKSKQQEIFKMFYKSPDIKNIEGSGIGLSKCKKIVKLHGGEINIESDLGVGTSFHFNISKHLRS